MALFSMRRASGDYGKQVFLHQLSFCIRSNIDMRESLDVCMKGCRGTMKKRLKRVKSAIEDGKSLSKALRENAPRMFPQSFYGILEAGEASGTLVETLQLLDDRLWDTMSFKWRLSGIIMYPLLVLLICVAAMLFLLLQVVPTFQEIFSDLGGKLPAPTSALLSGGHFFISHFFSFIVFSLGAVVALAILMSVAKRNASLNAILLRFPFFGLFMYHSNLHSIASLLSILMKAGATAYDALSLCETDALWPAFRKACREMRAELSEGKSFSDAVSGQKIFSPTFIWLATVGEQRGDLAGSFNSIREFEEAQLRHISGLLPRLFEPAMIVLVGVGIGFAIVAMWLPLLELPSLL